MEPATVITVAINGTPRFVTAATAFGMIPSNDQANNVRGGWSIVSAMITGQKRTNVSTMNTANAVLFTNADDRKKYAAEVPSSDGSPPPLAAVRKSFPKPWKKMATNTITLTRIEMLAAPMRFAVFNEFPWRNSPAKNVDQYA